MFPKLLALTLRIFAATIAVNLLVPDAPVWDRGIASAFLAIMCSIKAE